MWYLGCYFTELWIRQLVINYDSCLRIVNWQYHDYDIIIQLTKPCLVYQLIHDYFIGYMYWTNCEKIHTLFCLGVIHYSSALCLFGIVSARAVRHVQSSVVTGTDEGCPGLLGDDEAPEVNPSVCDYTLCWRLSSPGNTVSLGVTAVIVRHYRHCHVLALT